MEKKKKLFSSKNICVEFSFLFSIEKSEELDKECSK